MKAFAVLIAVVSAGLLGMQYAPAGALPIHVGIAGLALAGIVWFSQNISTFLRVFIVMYGLGFLMICAGNTLRGLNMAPNNLLPFIAPPFMATACACFAAIVFFVSRLSIVQTITGLADPYFHSTRPAAESYGFFGRWFKSEGHAARAMVGVIIAENFAQVAMQIKLNVWYRDLFDALEKKNADAFWDQIWLVFVPLLIVWIIVQMFDVTVDSIFQIRWREWMTKNYYTRWLDNGTHYKMGIAGVAADNPDQRISTDVNAFIGTTMSLSIRLLSQLTTLVSFTVILWGLSQDFTIPGTAVMVPGLLVWVAALYSIIGTIFAHLIGRPLIKLDFLQERLEANFRFALARLREYSEQIALLEGAKAEQDHLGKRFTDVVSNYLRILVRRLKLIGFTFSWQQISVAFPYIFMGGYYFAGKLTLGQLQQGSSAFGRVENALAFFMNAYASLAAYKATIDRLTTFREAMGQAEDLGKSGQRIAQAKSADGDLEVDALALSLPDGRTIVNVRDFELRGREAVLVSGPSGSGKSTFFRAISGIWPYGDGEIRVPDGRSVMLLPQRPYIPLGTLRAALSYPAIEGHYTDADVVAALKAVGLPALVDRLNDEDNWTLRLSGGEQQRLAVARALLAKPDWLFLDEATASLDEPSEAVIYNVIAEKLPETTVVSIGHRSTLMAFHRRKVELHKQEDGTFRPMDAAKAVPAE